MSTGPDQFCGHCGNPRTRLNSKFCARCGNPFSVSSGDLGKTPQFILPATVPTIHTAQPTQPRWEKKTITRLFYPTITSYGQQAVKEIEEQFTHWLAEKLQAEKREGWEIDGSSHLEDMLDPNDLEALLVPQPDDEDDYEDAGYIDHVRVQIPLRRLAKP